MGFVTLEDLYGKIDLVIFPQTWEKVYHLLDMDRVLLAEGRVDSVQGEPKILVNNLTPVSLEEMDHDSPGSDEDPPFGIDDDMLEDYLPDLPLQAAKPAHTQEEQAPEEDQHADEDDHTQNSDPVPAVKEEQQDYSEKIQLSNIEKARATQTAHERSPAAQARLTRENPAPKPFHVLTTPLTKPEPLPRADQKPRCIYITLSSCGDKQQDVRRLRRIHDILISRPGRDQFAFRVRENGYWYEFNLPNVTTGLTDTLVQKLRGLMGDQNIDIAQQP